MGIFKDTYITNRTDIDMTPIADAMIKNNRETNEIEKEKNEIEREKISSKDRANITAVEYKDLIIENYRLEQEIKKKEKDNEFYRLGYRKYNKFLEKICEDLCIKGILSDLLAENSEVLSVSEEDRIINIKLKYTGYYRG